MNVRALSSRNLFARTLLSVALGVAYSSSNALTTLPEFTWNPAGAGLSGTAFTADNVIVSDFASITLSGSSFTETGYLPVSSLQLNGQSVAAGGLNSTYSLYFQFTGAGTSNGPFSSLNYSLFGVNAVPTFGPGGTISAVPGAVQLASGSLVSGGTGTINNLPGAAATVTFVPTANSGFFVNPNAASFYSTALTSFINAEGTVTPTANGFMIDNGGGSLHFAGVIPEPETYALMLAGLAVVGFVARRRRS